MQPVQSNVIGQGQPGFLEPLRDGGAAGHAAAATAHPPAPTPATLTVLSPDLRFNHAEVPVPPPASSVGAGAVGGAAACGAVAVVGALVVVRRRRLLNGKQSSTSRRRGST